MNYWNEAPTRDDALDKIFDFLKLLSENKLDEAEGLVRVGSLSKFREILHKQLADYAVIIFDDIEFMQLPDDFSTAISNPYTMDENDIGPVFSGKSLELQHGETVRVRVGMFQEITPIIVEFMIYKLENQYFLNLMKVEKE